MFEFETWLNLGLTCFIILKFLKSIEVQKEEHKKRTADRDAKESERAAAAAEDRKVTKDFQRELLQQGKRQTETLGALQEQSKEQTESLRALLSTTNSLQQASNANTAALIQILNAQNRQDRS